MSKGPLRELNRITEPSSKSKTTGPKTGCKDDACFSCETSHSGEVKCLHDENLECSEGDHSGYCLDENCRELTEFSPDIPEPEMCYKCGKHGCHLKRCSRCKSTLYCSRECQKKDWQKHKKTCKIPDGCQDDLKTLLRQLTSNLVVSKARITFTEAKVKAERMFSGRQLFTDLSEVSTSPLNGIFVALIANMHMDFARHGVYIKDVNDKQTLVFFFLDNDKPEPNFSWNDLQTGNYICIANPSLHVFPDGQMGMRIDDADTVRIIK